MYCNILFPSYRNIYLASCLFSPEFKLKNPTLTKQTSNRLFLHDFLQAVVYFTVINYLESLDPTIHPLFFPLEMLQTLADLRKDYC